MMYLLPAVASGTPTLNVIHHCDALTLLKAIPAGSVDCVVTSPPYFNLRDYNVPGQIGLETTPQEFIRRLMEVFREVYRVMKPSATCWVNLGDTYNSGGGYSPDAPSNQNGGSLSSRGGQATNTKESRHSRILPHLPPKSLMMIPARFAIAMQDDGWILRSEIVWAKRAPMPESVTDRPTKSHEMIYLFANQGSYWYDQEAVRERASINSHGSPRANPGQKQIAIRQNMTGSLGKFNPNENNGRNLRDVWHLSPEPTSTEHFAAFPTEIPRRCILAGCPEKVCAVCGVPFIRQVEKTGGTTGKSWHDHTNDLQAGMHQTNGHNGGVGNARSADGQPYTRVDRGLHPACNCNAGTRPGVVLDFFMGTGTTAYMARKLGRNYIGCDLNADYVAMARRRLAQSDPYQSKEVAPGLIQKSMFAGMSV